MKALIRSLSIFITVFIVTACASVDERLKHEFEEMRRGPTGSPYKNITGFSSALQCMDRLMLANDIKDIPILIESIEDKTEAVNAGTRDMLISAISDMTVHSHAIKIIAYGKDSTNLISFMKVAKQGDAYKQMPLFDIQGSISQHDESIVSTGNSLGFFYQREGGGGYSNSTSLSTIAMDLNVLNVSDMSVVPGVNARNSIAVLRKGRSFDMDASINKLGVYFDISLSRTEGKTQALRNLVELSAVELIGKLTKVPYWQCLGATNRPAVKAGSWYPAAQQIVEHHDRNTEYQQQVVSEVAASDNVQVVNAGEMHSAQHQARHQKVAEVVDSAGKPDDAGILVHRCCKYGL